MRRRTGAASHEGGLQVEGVHVGEGGSVFLEGEERRPDRCGAGRGRG